MNAYFRDENGIFNVEVSVGVGAGAVAITISSRGLLGATMCTG